VTPSIAREKYQGFDPKTKMLIQRISDHLKKKGITLIKLYEALDLNKDGSVDSNEFVNMMYASLPELGLSMSDYAFVFNALDINNDGNLSINEFGMFVEGAKLDKM
jgi:Ca2+-binding EF-hand superfamily protein